MEQQAQTANQFIRECMLSRMDVMADAAANVCDRNGLTALALLNAVREYNLVDEWKDEMLLVAEQRGVKPELLSDLVAPKGDFRK